MNDGVLLRRYLQERDETAFLELVKRHMNLVYSTALRRMGSSSAAQDVSQSVFVLLAGKAASLTHSDNLAGWLHRTTCFKSSEHLRAERRRQFHQNKAAIMQEATPPDDADRWADLAHELDQAVDQLDAPERDLILWRFYTQASWQQIGARLGLSEDAARMRLRRALDKLRGKLAHASVLTVAALESWLDAHAVQPAPGTLLGQVAQALPKAPSSQVPGAASAAGAGTGLPLKTALISTAACALVGVALLQWQGRQDRAHSMAARLPNLAEPGLGGPALSRIAGVTPPKASPQSEVLLERLRKILHSNLDDGVLPPQDLRDAIADLRGDPDSVFGVLRQTAEDPTASQKAHERAIWGFWLLGESAPELVPQIVSVLAETIASPEKQNRWWHAADVLLHLSVPEGSVRSVIDALKRNPAAGVATLRFLSKAASRRPEEIAPGAREWLAGPEPLRFCAAVVLAGIPGQDPEPLLPILMTGASNEHALSALENLGKRADSATPQLRALLANAESAHQTWMIQRLTEVLASVAPETRKELPAVDAVLRDRENEAGLNRLLEATAPSVQDLVACLKNRKTSWKAALELEQLGPAAAEALPALREALADPENTHKTYLAQAIKAIDPASPKPLFERDDLLGAFRALRDTMEELGRGIDEVQRTAINAWSNEARNVTPEQLVEQAAVLGRIHPKLREQFVSKLLQTDIALQGLFTDKPQ